MATLTILNTRPARRNVAVASLLDKTRQARSKSSPEAMDRQSDLRSSTPRTTYHPCPGERYNWPAKRGAGQPVDRDNCCPTCVASALVSDPSTFALQSRVRHNCRPERGAANGFHLGLMGGRHDWPAQRGAGQPRRRDIYIYIYIYIYICIRVCACPFNSSVYCWTTKILKQNSPMCRNEHFQSNAASLAFLLRDLGLNFEGKNVEC